MRYHWIITLRYQPDGKAETYTYAEGVISPSAEETRQQVFLQVRDTCTALDNVTSTDTTGGAVVMFFSLEEDQLPRRNSTHQGGLPDTEVTRIEWH